MVEVEVTVEVDVRAGKPVRISDPLFKHASECARSLSHPKHPVKLLKGLRGLPDLRRLAKSLPTLGVPLDELNVSVAEVLQRGRRLPWARHLRICDAVLPVGASQKEYLTGKSRQALRTNLSRARDLGLTCAVVTTDDEKRGLVQALLKDLNEFSIRSENLFRYRSDTWMEARSSDGTQIGMALISQSGDYGLLTVLVGRQDYPQTSPARFILHTAVVEHVRAQGGKYLLTEGKSPLFLMPGLQFFQHLTGYRLMNILLTDGEKETSRRFRRDKTKGAASQADVT